VEERGLGYGLYVRAVGMEMLKAGGVDAVTDERRAEVRAAIMRG
jgi:hypothetical protein